MPSIFEVIAVPAFALSVVNSAATWRNAVINSRKRQEDEQPILEIQSLTLHGETVCTFELSHRGGADIDRAVIEVLKAGTTSPVLRVKGEADIVYSEPYELHQLLRRGDSVRLMAERSSERGGAIELRITCSEPRQHRFAWRRKWILLVGSAYPAMPQLY